MPDHAALIDAIAGLAEEIGRACPDCADKAQQIIRLAGDLHVAAADRASVRDAIAVSEPELSDAEVETTTEEVMRAIKDEP